MTFNKNFAVQTAFTVIFFLTLYVSLQAEYPFLKNIYSGTAELYFLLKYGFSLLIFATAWRYLYFESAEWKYSLRNTTITLLFLILLFLCYFAASLGRYSCGFFYGITGLLGGSTLGTIENRFRSEVSSGSFRLIPWIAPLPFLYCSTVIHLAEGWILIVISIFLLALCVVTCLILVKPQKKQKLLIGFFAVFFLGSICLPVISKIYNVAGCQIQNKYERSPLFPLLVLSVLHSEAFQQDVLILTEKKSTPEMLSVSGSMKMIRKLHRVAPGDFFRISNASKNSPEFVYHVILYDVSPADSLQNAMFLSADFFRNLKERLSPGGILALNLPVTGTDTGSDNSNSILCNVLGTVFPQLEQYSGGRHILCSMDRKKLIPDPEILEYRADKWGGTREYFPKGVFHLLLSDHKQIFPSEEIKSRSIDPAALSLQQQNPDSIFLTGRIQIQQILSGIPYFTWLFTLLILTGYAVFRYFYITKDKQNKFLSFDNGFFAGGLFMLSAVYLPFRWGYRFPLFDPYSFMALFCGFYCGMFSGRKFSRNKKFSLIFSAAGSLPLILFLFAFRENFYNGLLLFAGGLSCGFLVYKNDLCRKEYFFGAGSAFLLGTFSLLLPGVCHIPFFLAAAAAENIKNGFEKN